MMIAEYLGKCKGEDGIAADATVIVTDSDVLINTTPKELIEALDRYADDINVSLVFVLLLKFKINHSLRHRMIR